MRLFLVVDRLALLGAVWVFVFVHADIDTGGVVEDDVGLEVRVEGADVVEGAEATPTQVVRETLGLSHTQHATLPSVVHQLRNPNRRILQLRVLSHVSKWTYSVARSTQIKKLNPFEF